MAEIVLEPFLSFMLEKLFEKLTSPEVVNFLKGKKSIDDQQLKQLDLKLRSASRLLSDAEERLIFESDVKKWLDDLRDVSYRAQDLLEDIADEARSKHERESIRHGCIKNILAKLKSIFSSFTQFDTTVQEEMAKIMQDLNLLLDDKVVGGLKQDAQNSARSSMISNIAPLREESHVHGRDADKQKVLELLLSDDIWGNKVGVLPIVGMGGLGKTTLAQLVYDDSRLKECGFQHKAWVTVSTEFDFFRIMKIVLENVDPQTRDIKEQVELQHKLKEALKGKKFLFVLDDVWDEEYDKWDILKSTFAFGERGSKIIVTTRSAKVAQIVASSRNIYDLEQVSSDDCWKIFVDHAFDGDTNADPKLQEIGKRIVEKCNGLPLAVKSVGGLLSTEKDPKEWQNILSSHVWEGYESWSHKILPSLWLSYRYLPSSSLKQCFAYCSVFPKDYEIEKEKIILLWMAEGFLKTDHYGKKTMEAIGVNYFDILTSRSLFQRSSQNKSRFIMHDLVHDLAMFVSGEFCFVYEDSKDLKLLASKTRHYSHKGSLDDDLMKGLSEAKHLRTFIGLTYSSSNELIEELLTTQRPLRVLSPSRKEIMIQSLPDSFGNLKHLRYLDLSNSDFEEMPGSICALYYLQTLLLSNCKNLAQLPTNIGRLINLRHLNTTGSPLEEMPPLMGNLKKLQSLSDFVLGKSKGASINELGELQHLGGKLRVSGLQNVNSVEDNRETNLLRYKENLNELVFEWKVDTTDTITERDQVFAALQPHTNLKKLIVRGYGGFTFPSWIGDSSFSNIVSMDLSDNELCESLPPLGELPSLQELVIKDFRGVETIDEEFYGKNSCITPFQSLETLTFRNMPKWRQWSLISRAGGEKKCACFPHLKKLMLDGCPNLLIGSLPGSDTIENIKIKGCNKLEFPGNHRYASVRVLEIARSCDSLKSLPLDYFPRLEELVLGKCENFESLTFSEETTGTALLHHSLTSWTIEDCKNLRSLPEDMRMLLPSLSYLGIFRCPEIESFPQGGLPSNLKHLVIRDCNKLVAQNKQWGLQGLTSLTTLYIGGYDMVLDSFPDQGLLPISLKSLILREFPQLKILNGSEFQHLTSFEELWLLNCNELQSLPEQVLPSLRTLWIHDCPFLERRYRKWKGEDWHKISHIPDVVIWGNTSSEED